MREFVKHQRPLLQALPLPKAKPPLPLPLAMCVRLRTEGGTIATEDAAAHEHAHHLGAVEIRRPFFKVKAWHHALLLAARGTRIVRTSSSPSSSIGRAPSQIA